MPWGASRSEGSSGENVNHFNAVRMRVQGNGNLQMTLWSADNIRSFTLVPFTMAIVTNIQPTRLANFIEQRAALEFGTTEINEFLRINRIIIFVREFGVEYPM